MQYCGQMNTRNNSTSNRGNPNMWFVTELGLL